MQTSGPDSDMAENLKLSDLEFSFLIMIKF